MNDNDNHLINIYNNISKCNTLDDLITIYNNLRSEYMKRLLLKNLIDEVDNKFICKIRLLEKIKYYDDAYVLYHDIKKKLNDISKINTLNRIMKLKDDKNMSEFKFYRTRLKRSCPHCGKYFITYEDRDYVICGNTKKGFDSKGCGGDWCFQCGKKLCKNWYRDELFDTRNRYHNKNCCESSALTKGDDFNREYCQCINKYVNRLPFGFLVDR